MYNYFFNKIITQYTKISSPDSTIMNYLRKYFTFRDKNFPWALLGISLLAFGVLIPWLGFYQDDWHHVFYYSQGGAEGLKNYLFTDSRPFSYLIYVPLFKLLGLNPIGWQIYALVTRFLIVFTFLASFSSRVSLSGCCALLHFSLL